MDSKCASSIAVIFLSTLSICSSRAAYAAQPSNPCSLLTRTQVGAVLGMKVIDLQLAGRCSWSAPNPSPTPIKQASLTISYQQAFLWAKASFGGSVKSEPASGICEDAFYAGTPNAPVLGASLYVKEGNSYFVVHVLGFSDQFQTMAEKTLAIQACSNLRKHDGMTYVTYRH